MMSGLRRRSQLPLFLAQNVMTTYWIIKPSPTALNVPGCCIFHVADTCIEPKERIYWLQDKLKEKMTFKLEEILNDLLSAEVIFKDSKRCPACNIVIQKIEGCNTMTCSHCQKKFCYECGCSMENTRHFAGSCLSQNLQPPQPLRLDIPRLEVNVGLRQRRRTPEVQSIGKFKYERKKDI